MLRTAVRETLLLMAATAISWFTVRMNRHVDFDTRMLGVLLPFVYCIGRLAVLKYPPVELPWWRRTGFQVAMGLALVCLLLFEEVVAIMPRGRVGWHVWITLTGFGAGYVLLFCLADLLRHSHWELAVRQHNASLPEWDPRTWGLQEQAITEETEPGEQHRW